MLCDFARKMCRHRLILSGPLPDRVYDERSSSSSSSSRNRRNFAKNRPMLSALDAETLIHAHGTDFWVKTHKSCGFGLIVQTDPPFSLSENTLF